MPQEQTTGAYLVIQTSSLAGKRIELWKDCTTIGRSRDSDIFLEDIAVHRKQARILYIDHGYVLRDDHGSEDSFVNGQPVREQLLNNGDQLHFGNTQITFYAHEGTRPFQLPSSRGRELHIGKAIETQSVVVAHLKLINAKSNVNSIELLPGMTIGRSRECDIFLEDLTVSRHHATINEVAPGQFEITDHHSATGTFVNNQPIVRYMLQEGDELQIGKNTFTFHCTESS
ncbi:MAG TPA: FHA domain-containing protein [Dictyobacter sp.]|jgi:pSer/pThr/pTyr-binding forkhead associated (FHA) protein|nr:FHA domain-containing protein [Dictyobacter sp.]